ncbi:MAG: sigma 54-interacting transcriptional regulator, partial [Anaerovoracaceae bacterium]
MKEQEEINYSLIFDHLPGAMVINLQGEIVYLNEQCADYIGVNQKESLGRPVNEVFPKTQMMKNLGIQKPKIVFYNSFGVGISVHLPLYRDGERIGLLEYDVAQSSELLYDFTDEYTQFLDSQLKSMQKEIQQLRNTKYSINNIIGESEEIKQVKKEIIDAARNNSTVIIFGETGTGKELVAHSIHRLSKRLDKPFIKINASGIPETLVESELFGYEEGAFTGAVKNGKKGKFELAHKGTLYLDEINQMPLTAQSKLLRALQEKEIERIGGSESIPVDVRIIVTTNEDLRTLVEQGKFREDLFYRLHVVVIQLPPLRKRKKDIRLLVDHFVQLYGEATGKTITKVAPEVYSCLTTYSWPGNIRELQNTIERAVNFATEGEL